MSELDRIEHLESIVADMAKRLATAVAAPLHDRTAGYFPQENEPQNPTKEGSES